MQTIWARDALTVDGWQENVRVTVTDGAIGEVASQTARAGHAVDMLLPAPSNLHSHAFQRAMAGLTERRGPEGSDSFWTWRRTMYRFVERLTPDDVEAIAAFAQLEMAEAGYAAVGEFQYLHNAPGGAAYDDPAELSARIAAAAADTGLGLTLLPVFYEQGGCDGRALEGGQLRFGNDRESYVRILDGGARALAGLPDDARLGLAPHSLRAVSPSGMAAIADLSRDEMPIHVHAAEQVAEVEEVEAHLGARPVEWLLNAAGAGDGWCLIHATQMTEAETAALAASGAVAGLCPVTEADLGDGIFDGVRFLDAGGRFGVGTDSNVRITLAGELRMLEYSQRLRDRSRAALAGAGASVGRTLFETAALGGARAIARRAGSIAPGRLADLVALDLSGAGFEGRGRDTALDTFLFGAADGAVSDVWSAGRHIVAQGRHVKRDAIEARYRRCIRQLGAVA